MHRRIIAFVAAALFAMLASVMLIGSASAGEPTPARPAGAVLAADGESVSGTVQYRKDGDQVALPDVGISVQQDGAEVGSATTDADGKWTVAVPGPGVYQVVLDLATLPAEVQLRTEGADTREITVTPGSDRPAIFPLVPAGEGSGATGGGGGGGGSDEGWSTEVKYYVSVVLAGIRYGIIIAITAVGLSLIFGTTGLINFAHGELVTIGAVVAFLFSTSPMTLPLIAAVVIAIIATGAVGGLIERGLWRPLRRRKAGLIQMFIVSIGLSLLIRHLILLFFGSRREQYADSVVQPPLEWGPISIAPRDLIIIVLSTIVLIGVAVMLQRTRMGKAMRAVADNKDLARASGIDVDQVILRVWILGGGLAALGGVFFGLSTAVYWDMGFNLLLMMFAGVILGGLGSAYGAMLGSLVVGIVAQLSTVWFGSDLMNAWALLVLIIVLLVRPQGILGRAQRAG